MLWMLAAVAAPTYTLSFPDRQAHLLDVSATLDATGDATELFMATWTPGSYLVREYARHVEGLEAVGADDRPLDLRKVSKNRWVVETAGVERFTLRYRVYCRSHNVRGNTVTSDFAVLNGAPTFIVPAALEGPYRVEVRRPDGWDRTMTQLSPDDSDTFEAATYDRLVDSPIAIGSPEVTAFEVAGVEHVLVDLPKVAPWDSGKAAKAVKKQVEEQLRFWGAFPYERYLFLNLVTGGRGGLEHLDSTLMITRPGATEKEDAFESWLGLVSHEHFHAWNVKRLRPAALGPFDYQDEVYTESLWIAEGFTSYYDDVLLARAGLIETDVYLERMSKNLQRIASTPGRREQPVARASFDTWIEHYRQDENSVNTAISYYTKGAVIAWVLDARIRSLTRGKASLDDAMRLAYTRYSGEVGYTPDQFVEVLSEVAGEDLGPFVHGLVHTTDELPLSEAAEWFGLTLQIRGDELPTAWLGLSMNGTRVATVRRDGPSFRAGLNVGDEILALDGVRVGDFGKAVAALEIGREVEVLISRRDRIRTLRVTPRATPGKPQLSIDATATGRAKKQREAWIGE